MGVVLGIIVAIICLGACVEGWVLLAGIAGTILTGLGYVLSAVFYGAFIAIAYLFIFVFVVFRYLWTGRTN